MSQSVKKFIEIPNHSPESFFNETNFFLQKNLSLWNFYSRKCSKKARTNLSLASPYLRYQHDTCKDLISTWQMAIQHTLLFTGLTPPSPSEHVSSFLHLLPILGLSVQLYCLHLLRTEIGARCIIHIYDFAKKSGFKWKKIIIYVKKSKEWHY